MTNETIHKSQRISNSDIARLMCLLLGIGLILAGFILEPPAVIWQGLISYVTCPDILITDYFVVGSIGAALVNAGLVTFMSIGLVHATKTSYTASTVSAIFLMAGFALFGKNPVNILPFFLGVWIYCKVKKQRMSRYINAAFFSTALAPIVSDAMNNSAESIVLRLIAAVFSGACIGYIIIPLSERSFAVHQGYSHFNIGFAGGLLALVIASVAQAMGHPVDMVMIWNKGVPPLVLLFMLLLIFSLMFGGLWISKFDIKACLNIMRHSGRSPTDFIITDGIGVTMFNMGLMGAITLGYVLLIGGDLNGPVMGAILTVIGFASAGEHPRNGIPIMTGVYLASLVMRPSNTDPGMLLAALFGMSLAPISGQFGITYGIIAGFIHAAVVLVVGAPCGGYNLYNNGFSAGLVGLVMLSFIQGTSRHWRHTDR
ncbi:MAG: DUF1576 domain-containing protein [Oscillospiraceae bacterium]|nr:DUF1576 domain-containing protein [Oscillospiraceae bacterium]